MKAKVKHRRGGKTGRPTKLDKMNYSDVAKLCAAGLTDAQLAEVFGVHVDTVGQWKRDVRFYRALKSKGIADKQVEASLWKRAIGYEYSEVTTEHRRIFEDILNEAGEIIDKKESSHLVVTKIVTKKQPADILACIFWLKNRQPDKWRDKTEHDIKSESVEALIKQAFENK